MKYIKYLSLMVAAMLTFASCETDIERPSILPIDEVVAPVLNEMSDVAINANNGDELVTFISSKVDFGQNIVPQYLLYLTYGDVVANVTSSTKNMITVTKKDLNSWIVNSLGVEANEVVEIGAYIVAQAGNAEVFTAPSNTVNFTVSTFKAAFGKIHIVGVFNNWTNAAGMPCIWETAGGSKIYSGMFNMTENANANGLSGFKFVIKAGDWDNANQYNWDSFSSMSECVVNENTDGNLEVPVGYYKITVDANKMSLETIKVSHCVIRGSWDASWNVPIAMVYDASTNIWKSETAIDGGSEFKLCLDMDWKESYGVDDGGAAEIYDETDNLPAENIALGDGDGDANITVPGTGKFYVCLHANRTPWALSFQAE